MDGFDGVVVCFGEGLVGGAWVGEGLFVGGEDGAVWKDGLVGGGDGVVLIPVFGVVCVGVGEVLVELAAGGEGEHLHAQADAQEGDLGGLGVLVELVDEGGFEGLAGIEDWGD